CAGRTRRPAGTPRSHGRSGRSTRVPPRVPVPCCRWWPPSPPGSSRPSPRRRRPAAPGTAQACWGSVGRAQVWRPRPVPRYRPWRPRGSRVPRTRPAPPPATAAGVLVVAGAQGAAGPPGPSPPSSDLPLHPAIIAHRVGYRHHGRSGACPRGLLTLPNQRGNLTVGEQGARVDEVRQADGTDPASSPAWAGGEGRDVGDGRAAGGAPGWAPATEPPESAVEPLALLTTTGANEERPAGGRRYAPGLDDDTPVGGLPMAEPPLWREAAHSAGLGYGALSQYDPAGPTGEFATVPPPEQPAGLPQRVPAEPDVPELPESEPGNRERWTAPELAWIADQLKRDDVPHEPAEGLDVDAVLAAVRDVPGVRSASVRPNPDGIHTLRLDLADDADPGQVSRLVARLLEERMGLSAAPNHPVGQAPWSTPTEPSGTG